jgi:hypothetical protein
MKIKRDSALNLRIPLETKLILTDLASREDISATSLVLRWIREGLAASTPATNVQVHEVVTEAIKAKAKKPATPSKANVKIHEIVTKAVKAKAKRK